MRLTVRGVSMHYVERGAGPRTALLIHGAPGDHRQLAHHFEPIFAERSGWRRIYPDMPGMGATSAADWISGQDDMLEIALGFADAVAPEERFTIVGSSWGGYIALAMARRRPERVAGLMLLVPMTRADAPDAPDPQVLVRDPRLPPATEPAEQRWERIAPVQTAETLAAFRASVKPGLLSADPGLMDRLRGNWALSDDPPRPDTPLSCPALILTARQDPIVGYRDAWALLDVLPRATYAALDRAGHGLAAEQAALARALTSEWLDRVEEYAPTPPASP